jgi:hypothetical protein
VSNQSPDPGREQGSEAASQLAAGLEVATPAVDSTDERAKAILAFVDRYVAAMRAAEAAIPCSCPEHRADPALPPHGLDFPREQQAAWHSGYTWGQRSIVNTLLADARAEVETAALAERKRLTELLRAAFEHANEDESTVDILSGISYAIDIIGDPSQWAFLLAATPGLEAEPDNERG